MTTNTDARGGDPANTDARAGEASGASAARAGDPTKSDAHAVETRSASADGADANDRAAEVSGVSDARPDPLTTETAGDRTPMPGRVVYGVTIGGSAFSLLRGQLAWLRERGWDVRLVSSPDDEAHIAAEREDVRFYGLPMTRSITPIQDAIALRRWLKLLGKLKPAAINVGTPKAGLLGGVAGWLRRVPQRLYVVRGLRIEGTRGPLSWVLWLTEWATMRVATDVLFVSPSLALEAQRRGLLDGRKSWAIGSGSSNGVLAHEVAARAGEVDRRELRERLGLGADDFVVGFVGRITYDKGVDQLIEAFGRVTDPRIRLLCIGEPEDEQLAAQVGVLGDRVRRVGYTSDLWGHLPAMDVLCLPTLREGFPNVVLEASSVGMPTITTRATGAVDSVIDGVTGLLFDVGDTDALLRHIHTLANDWEKRERMGAAARQRVLTEFQPERIWSGVEEILQGVAEPRVAHRVTGK